MKTKPFLSLLPALLCATVETAFAGGLNIVNLAHGGDLVVNVEFDKTSQNMIVKPKGYSGAFGLPETKVKLSATMEKAEVIEIPATTESYLAILAKKPKGFEWHLVPSKRTEGKWAFRIVNLTDAPLPVLDANQEEKELQPDSETSFPAENKGQVRVKIVDSDLFSYKGDEPCSVVALVYKELEEWKVLFVPEF